MPNDDAKLFVAGLPDSVSEEVLRQLFEATGGKVLQVSLPKDRATGRHRGFGFVTLSTAEEAQAARDALDGSLQGGRSISVRPFQAEPPRRGEGGPPSRGGPGGPPSRGGGFDRGPSPSSGGPRADTDRKLYIGNLPYDTTQEELEVLVNAATNDTGNVVHVNMPIDHDGRKRGFGFVTLSSSDAAKNAAENLKTADLRGRRLVVNIAHPKGDRPGGFDRPPREGGFDRPGGFGGGGFGGGGGGFGGGGPPSGGGGPPGGFGPPAPARKTFDDNRRKRGTEGEGGPPRKKKERGGAGAGGKPSKDDWDDD